MQHPTKQHLYRLLVPISKTRQDKQDMQYTAKEAKMNSYVTFFQWTLTQGPTNVGQQERTFSNCSMRTQGGVWKGDQNRWSECQWNPCCQHDMMMMMMMPTKDPSSPCLYSLFRPLCPNTYIYISTMYTINKQKYLNSGHLFY